MLGLRVRGRYSREYCGGGSLKRCRRALRGSLRAALAVPASELYGGDPKCPTADQWCFDAVSFRRHRRRHAAADPLDQPPDVPAGERDPGTGAALAVLASAGWKLSTRISWSIASCGVPSVVTVEK